VDELREKPGEDMDQNLTAHEVAQLLNLTYEQFRKNSYLRRPPVQDDGTYLKSDVVAWWRAKVARKEAWLAMQAKFLMARMAKIQAELDLVKRSIEATTVEMSRINDSVTPDLPIATHPVFMPEVWFAGGQVVQGPSAEVINF
jgi:hypothetical protein